LLFIKFIEFMTWITSLIGWHNSNFKPCFNWIFFYNYFYFSSRYPHWFKIIKKNIGWEHKLAFKNYVRIFYKYFLFTWDFFHASNYFVRIVSSNSQDKLEFNSTNLMVLLQYPPIVGISTNFYIDFLKWLLS
jgi:hypothetical protein